MRGFRPDGENSSMLGKKILLVKEERKKWEYLGREVSEICLRSLFLVQLGCLRVMFIYRSLNFELFQKL